MMGNTQTITDTRKEIELILKRLAWAWAAPELGRHRPDDLGNDIAGIGEPLIQRAWSIIKQGREAIFKALASDDQSLIALLMLIQDEYMPPKKYVDRIQRIHDKQRPLADDFFQATEQEPVMVAPIGPLDGSWPRKPGHTCRHAARFKKVGPEQWRYEQMSAHAWRGRMCEACYYDRVMTLSRQIEHEAIEAGGMENIKHKIMTDGQYQKFTGRVRARRKRKGEILRFMALPIYTGGYFVVFIDLKEEGQPIPTDRAELFDLIAIYADTDPERRASSSSGWGGSWANLKGDGRKKAQEDNEGDSPKKELSSRKKGDTGPDVTIICQNKAKLLRYAEELGYKHKQLQKGKSGDLFITDIQFIELLQVAEIRHQVVIGREYVDSLKSQLKGDVTDKGQVKQDNNNNMSLKRDKDKPPPIKQAYLLGQGGVS